MSLPSSMADLYHVIVSCKRPIEGLDLRTTLNFGGGGGGWIPILHAPQVRFTFRYISWPFSA